MPKKAEVERRLILYLYGGRKRVVIYINLVRTPTCICSVYDRFNLSVLIFDIVSMIVFTVSCGSQDLMFDNMALLFGSDVSLFQVEVRL